MRTHRLDLTICLFLIVAILAVYWQLPSHGFINLDDNIYVTENPNVQRGLTRDTTIWAFRTTHANFWHPLTWLSHMLDCELFGLNPGMHHLTNLLFHIANSILLFLVFRRMTGAIWRSASVAALFALHPLHVESVAWISERKDVLSTLFWFLAMWAYVRYAERPGLSRYILVLIFFALGLMAKPMVVTLPFVLLLMDFWPLGRLQLGQRGTEGSIRLQSTTFSRLIREKVPFLALAALISIIAFSAQGEALGGVESFPLGIRAANAAISYISYIGKMFFPKGLAVFYPYPATIPIRQAIGAGLLLICLSVVFIKMSRRFPYLKVGWLWYLGTLVPVIGLVQVGSHAMADRYTYLPLIGLFVIIAWGGTELAGRWRYRRVALGISGGILATVFMICTWFQVRHWKDSVTLFTHSINVTTDNFMMHYNLGNILRGEGRFNEAIKHYSETLRIKPEYFAAHTNLGVALARQGRLKDAIRHYNRALQIRPDLVEAHNGLGIALARQGNLEEAIFHFSEALRIDPENSVVQHNLERALRLSDRSSVAPKSLPK